MTGDKDVSRKIRAYGKRAENIPPRVWQRVGAYMSRVSRQQFTSEGARLGRKWKPLKPEYRLWKIRSGFNRKILVQTGAMRQGFTGRPMDIEEYHKNSATFGSSNQKAIWHHYGTRRNGEQVNPPRPILVVTPEIAKDVRDILADHVAGRNRA